MTLDKAIAELECELNIAPDVRIQSGLIDQDWKGKRAHIRAAVRKVALAAVAECWRDCTTLAAAEARLARQFGLPKGSEKEEG
jgi:hypothetical protein